MDPNTFDVDAWLNSARLPEKTHPLCLRGDLVADYENLKRRKAEVAKTDSLAGESAEIEEQLDRLREEMKTATVVVRMRAMPKRRWDELINAHKPREDNELDQAIGYDPDAFFNAAIPESIVEPKLTPAQWAKLSESLTEAQYNDLVSVVNDLNVRKVDIPN
jgi:hypothetical protein